MTGRVFLLGATPARRDPGLHPYGRRGAREGGQGAVRTGTTAPPPTPAHREASTSGPGGPLGPWTDRLLRLGTGIPPEDARAFVRDLYARARADRDEERAEAGFEREE
ncbi:MULTISPECIES: hypothetical protein [unclassified Streptomyces]|uniref:hypothetical protein n=1 Tax=unclassified Streptomyces TaxID=2593676 RepID=UPI0006B04507|nr:MULTISPECIES: hypothetical protein [unclassified Streptomyces]KOX26052.1 hypothetical protein ADL06_16670 [Streptomyces sp. NRRL F-6491]KOX41208.1 hypothetical protein ADL08_19750 [Streptomyces sp. NRRL F-6492]